MKVQHRKAAQAYCYLLLKWWILLLTIFTERSSERNNSSGLYCTQNAFTDKQCCCEPGWEQTHTFTLVGMIHINSSKDWLFKQLQFQSPVAQESEGTIQKGWRCKYLSQKEAELFLNLKRRKKSATFSHQAVS